MVSFRGDDLAALLEEAKRGDHEAWLVFERRTSPSLLRRMAELFSAVPHWQIEEIIADAYFRIWQTLERFDSIERTRSYIRIAVYHKLAKTVSRSVTTVSVESLAWDDLEIAFEAREPKPELQIILRDQLQLFSRRLSPAERLYLDNVLSGIPSAQDIAMRERVSRRTINRRIAAMRRSLTDFLGED